MKISCQSCQAKYTIADDKVLGKIVKIRCKKCGETIVVNGSGAAEEAVAGPAYPEPTAAPPAPSARRAGGRAPTGALFGGVAQAGSEEDVMTSAPAGMPQARASE